MTEYEAFYELRDEIAATHYGHDRQQLLLARGHVKSTGDWHALYRAKAAYGAALLAMAEFQARIDGQPAAADAERTAA